MKRVERKVIDWKKTGRRLRGLRNNNASLRRYVCWHLRYDAGECSGECDVCEYEMDVSISRNELAEVFCTTESVIFNWENGKTPPDLSDLIMYSEITGLSLEEIVVFEH